MTRIKIDEYKDNNNNSNSSHLLNASPLLSTMLCILPYFV